MAADVTGFFEERTSTISYVIRDPGSDRCAIVDPVLNYDPVSGRASSESADGVIAFVRDRGWTVEWILETHIHADHLSAAQHVKQAVAAPVAIGAHVPDVQRVWKDVYNLGDVVPADGSQFDRLCEEGDHFSIGGLDVEVWHTPGHTPACATWIVGGEAAFVGDTLFMPDGGTARADFPGGDARTLYRSIRRILSLPPGTRIFVCHDYQPNGRQLAWETTVAAQRAENIHVRDGVTEDEFVDLRTARDQTLSLPNLLLPSLQVNIRAGALPDSESNGTAYLKIPINRF